MNRSTNNVFVAGATGVLGWRAVDQLVRAGHHVTGVARTDEKSEFLRRLGAAPVRVDLFDATAVNEAVAGHDVVVNLATHIPSLERAAVPGAWSENDRIRREVSRNLVDAALATGASRYIQEGISFIYEDRAEDWLDEESPLDVPPWIQSSVEAEKQAERFATNGGAGVVLRFGQFYGPDAAHSTSMRALARRRLRASIGDGRGYATVVQLDDAAAAVVAALGAPTGTYNVTDDEPLTKDDLDAVIAAAVGAKPPVIDPTAASRLAGAKGEFLRRSQRVSNRKFRERDRVVTQVSERARDGWPMVAAAMPERRSFAFLRGGGGR